MLPMFATRGDHVPRGDQWVHEVKWDGMRALVDVRPQGVRDRTVRAFSRNENDVSVSFPELRGLAELDRDLLLDGEVVVVGRGVPTFGALQERMHVREAARAARLAERAPVALLAFDLLRLDGQELLDRPLHERRALLEGLGMDFACAQVPATYDDGDALLAAAREQGLEGVISKKLTSRYRPGQRSRDWLKFPIRPTASYVVGGFRPERGSPRLGALLVGEPTEGGVAFRGRVGSGVTGKAAARLTTLLSPLIRERSPFTAPLPREDSLGTTWVDPVVIVEIAHLGVTIDGRLRQPAYQGVRTDLTSGDLG